MQHPSYDHVAMETETYLIIAAVFLAAGVVKGISGLGLPTISMALLSLMMAPAKAAMLSVSILMAVRGSVGLISPQAPYATRTSPRIKGACPPAALILASGLKIVSNAKQDHIGHKFFASHRQLGPTHCATFVVNEGRTIIYRITPLSALGITAPRVDCCVTSPPWPVWLVWPRAFLPQRNDTDVDLRHVDELPPQKMAASSETLGLKSP